MIERRKLVLGCNYIAETIRNHTACGALVNAGTKAPLIISDEALA